MGKIIHIIFGCLLAAIGVILLGHAHLITGGTAGLSLSLSYMWGTSFSFTFFIVNIPFYILSVMRMGWGFTISTLFAVLTLSIISGMDHWLPSFYLHPFVGSVFGGVMLGLGLSTLFLNRSSLGGANILALLLQKRWGWDPGKVTFFFDCLVVSTGFYSIGWWRGFYSILSIVILSSIISYFKGRIASQNSIHGRGYKRVAA